MTEFTHPTSRVVAVVVMCIVLGACASKGTVVLLPEKDGRPTAVTVKQGDQEIVLDQPYAAAKSTLLGPRAFSSSPQEVESQFGSALAAQPSRPSVFTLYFVEGKDEFTGRVATRRRHDPLRSRAAAGAGRAGRRTYGCRRVRSVQRCARTAACGGGPRRVDSSRCSRCRHSGNLARKTRAGGSDCRGCGGAAQSKGRDPRPLKRADA